MLDTDAGVIRVLIVDDHPLMRKGLADILEGIEDIQVVGAAEDGAAALALAHAVKPDIVLMDISMPGMDGIEATEKLVEMDSSARVVMLTSYSEREKITQALAAGAVSYLTKDSPPDAVIRAIRSAAMTSDRRRPECRHRLTGRVAAAPRGALPPHARRRRPSLPVRPGASQLRWGPTKAGRWIPGLFPQKTTLRDSRTLRT